MCVRVRVPGAGAAAGGAVREAGRVDACDRVPRHLQPRRQGCAGGGRAPHAAAAPARPPDGLCHLRCSLPLRAPLKPDPRHSALASLRQPPLRLASRPASPGRCLPHPPTASPAPLPRPFPPPPSDVPLATLAARQPSVAPWKVSATRLCLPLLRRMITAVRGAARAGGSRGVAGCRLAQGQDRGRDHAACCGCARVQGCSEAVARALGPALPALPARRPSR